MNEVLFKNVRYYAAYQITYVVTVVLLSSIGAFFHFLLDHEISIVESWLHHNHWELLIASKLFALFLINRWFKIRLYELKSIRQLVKELVRWPEPKAIVISVFMVVSYLVLGDITSNKQNFGYWYNHGTAFLGLFLFFGIEFIVIAYLDDVLNVKTRPSPRLLGPIYTLFFTLAVRLTVPDYYGLLPYVVLCYGALVFLSGEAFRIWSNVVCFLLLFVAPMGALFGLDPVWGDDFSPFQIAHDLNPSFLVAIWMISFGYYKYRDRFVGSVRKLLR